MKDLILNDNVKKLLESPIKEDVILGMKIFLKQNENFDFLLNGRFYLSLKAKIDFFLFIDKDKIFRINNLGLDCPFVKYSNAKFIKELFPNEYYENY